MTVFKQLYVYILLCSDDSYYIGITNNVEQRIAYHNEGLDKEAYTYERRPVKFVCRIIYGLQQAIAREKQLKKWTRWKKEALIKENWNKLKEFSASVNT